MRGAGRGLYSNHYLHAPQQGIGFGLETKLLFLNKFSLWEKSNISTSFLGVDFRL